MRCLKGLILRPSEVSTSGFNSVAEGSRLDVVRRALFMALVEKAKKQ